MTRDGMHHTAPVRITAESGPWPLHGAAAAKAMEADALARCAAHELMERAGLAVARLARALAPAAGLVEVWCGPGNNGGDGYVAARWLHLSGTPVRLLECGTPARLPADAARARALAIAAGISPLSPSSPSFLSVPSGPSAKQSATEIRPDLVIDALLGLGASRPPQGALAGAIGRINSSGATVLAVDLPSGLDADTGQPLGDAVVRADHTLALLTLKPGLFTALGRDLAGDAWFDDLGRQTPAAADPDAAPTAHLLGPMLRHAPPHAWHKGRRGDAWVVGGAPGMVGAAWLAAHAALSAGAGRVYLSLLAPDAALALDAGRPELMQRPWAAASAQLCGSATVIAGCGGGGTIRDCLPRLLAHAPRLVLDADALNHVAHEPALLRLLQGRAGRAQGTVLTPHPLEAARLAGIDSAAVQDDRLRAATALAAHMSAVVVLKGSGTVIAAPATLPCINPSN